MFYKGKKLTYNAWMVEFDFDEIERELSALVWMRNYRANK